MSGSILPYAAQSVVEQGKITQYLLNPAHPTGGPKADFFLRFGFTVQRWQELADALRLHAQTVPVASVMQTPSGTVYTIIGTLQTPDGRNPAVKAVWQVDTGTNAPRLISAYPAGKRGSP